LQQNIFLKTTIDHTINHSSEKKDRRKQVVDHH